MKTVSTMAARSVEIGDFVYGPQRPDELPFLVTKIAHPRRGLIHIASNVGRGILVPTSQVLEVIR